MIKILIEYNKHNIGISILDLKDKLGLTSLHYCVILNNFEKQRQRDEYLRIYCRNNGIKLLEINGVEYKSYKLLNFS